jgi:hypothetical protein
MSTVPPGPDPVLAVCYRCGEPLKGVCGVCGKFYCYLHGGLGMRLCSWHSLIVVAVAVGITLALMAGTFIGFAMSLP